MRHDAHTNLTVPRRICAKFCVGTFDSLINCIQYDLQFVDVVRNARLIIRRLVYCVRHLDRLDQTVQQRERTDLYPDVNSKNR